MTGDHELRQQVLANLSTALGIPRETLDTIGDKLLRLEEQVLLLRHTVAMRESAKHPGILYIPEGVEMPEFIPFGDGEPIMPIIIRVPSTYTDPFGWGGDDDEVTVAKRTGWQRFKDALLKGW